MRGKWIASAVIAAMLGSAALFGWLSGSFTDVGDVWLFSAAGSTLLSDHWVHAFHVGAVQAGPLELVVTSLAKTAGGGHTGFAIALDVFCWAAVCVVVGMLLGWRPLELALFGAGACAVSLPAEGYRGHPADLFIGVLWPLAAREARRGRLLAAGGLVGASACFEVWGVLGVAVLALAPSIRRTAWPIALTASIPVAVFLPFVLGGDFHMFEFRWNALRWPADMIVGYGNPFPWELRLAQGAVVVAVGCLVARLVRRLPESIWIVPAAVMLTRIALDPIVYGYYYDPALLALLMAGASLFAHPRALAGRIASAAERSRSPVWVHVP
jgi:hypothetical protein